VCFGDNVGISILAAIYKTQNFDLIFYFWATGVVIDLRIFLLSASKISIFVLIKQDGKSSTEYIKKIKENEYLQWVAALQLHYRIKP
jgi:hypothetical protein